MKMETQFQMTQEVIIHSMVKEKEQLWADMDGITKPLSLNNTPIKNHLLIIRCIPGIFLQEIHMDIYALMLN